MYHLSHFRCYKLF